jgi:hypothetical protein
VVFIKSLFRILIISGLVVMVGSCLTDRSPLHVQDRPIKTQIHEEITTTLRFVDEAILTAKYRDEVNPFLTNYNKMQLRRVMVFELTVENQSEEAIQFIMNRVELQYGGKTLQPYNRFQLGQHWEFTDEEAKGIHKSRREKIIEETVLPNSYTIPAGGAMKGYVVFIGNTPNYGSAMVYVPLFESTDVVRHRFEFPFDF